MFYVFDSDGNPISEGDLNGEDAIMRACTSAIAAPNWERLLVAYEDKGAKAIEIAHVERLGPKGTRRVRIALACCGWVSIGREV